VKAHLVDEFVKEAASAADNLPHCALLMARVEYPELDPSPFLRQLEQMGATAQDHVQIGLGGSPPRRRRLRIVTDFLFGQLGFVGNREHYDDPRNSLLNDVLSRRMGIPISLAVVFIDVAQRVGLAVEGVNFPGHFLVRCLPDADNQVESAPLLVDPFHAGTVLTDAECARLLRSHMGVEAMLEPGMLRTASKRDILLRMLLNLNRAYMRRRSFAQAHAVTELLVALDPAALAELRDRGLLAAQLREYASALRDLESWLQLAPTSDDERDERKQVWDHVKDLRRQIASLN
jgi:regulator of sirC expression with transglutaminase-like and TPR domain